MADYEYTDTSYSGTIQPASGGTPHKSVWGMATAHPYIAFVILLFLAIIIGYVYNKVKNGSSAATAPGNTPGTAEGLPTTNAQGQPVYYVPTSNEFLNYNKVADSYNTSNSDNTTSTSTSTTTINPPVPTPVVTPTPCKAGVDYGLIPWDEQPKITGKTFTYKGTKYAISPGSQGRIWGTTSDGGKTLLYQPKSFYPGGINSRCPAPSSTTGST